MISPTNAMKAINKWLDHDGGYRRGDAIVLSKAEWRKRGEPYGNDAICTMIIDGSPVYESFNYGTYGWDELNKFQLMLAELGLWMEQGFAWSVHIYRK